MYSYYLFLISSASVSFIPFQSFIVSIFAWYSLLPSLFDHFQFTLIHGPNIPGSYAILFFAASNFTSITSHIHSWLLFFFGSIFSFFLELFLHWSPVVYWAPTDLGSSSFSVLSFCFLILFMGFSRQEYWSGLPFPSLGTTFCQTSPSWPVHLGLPHGHGLVSLS